MEFANWDSSVNSTDDAQKRIKKAQSADLTPISIDFEAQTGLFNGSGKKPYDVRLDFCSCGDFRRRKLPCKHIYRLAMELGLIENDYEIGIDRYSLNKQLFSLPVDTQSIFYELCYCCAYYKQQYFLFSKEEEKYLTPLLTNGFAIFDTSDYARIIEENNITVAEIKEVFKDIDEESKPKYNSQKTTYIKWLSEIEKTKPEFFKNNVLILELTKQTVEKSFTILSRFKKKFIPITVKNSCTLEDTELFFEEKEYEKVFNNEII